MSTTLDRSSSHAIRLKKRTAHERRHTHINLLSKLDFTAALAVGARVYIDHGTELAPLSTVVLFGMT